MQSTASCIELKNFHCVVAYPRDRDGELLIRSLQRLGCRVVHLWPPENLPEEQIDLLFCNVNRTALAILRLSTSQAGLPVVGILESANTTDLKLLSVATPHALLVCPLDSNLIPGQILLAENNARFQARQQSKITKLEETLRSYRKVEQAKAILMSRRKIGEPEAYGFLREQAMRRRVSIGALASAIVDASEMLWEE
jgi:AmiR/NasT family two-component response regulator